MLHQSGSNDGLVTVAIVSYVSEVIYCTQNVVNGETRFKYVAPVVLGVTGLIFWINTQRDQ